MDFEDKANELNQLFGLRYVGQDWAYVNADANKLNAFVEYYLQTSDNQEISMVFDLIINSLQGLEDRNEFKSIMDRIKDKVAQNFDKHSYYIKFYAQLGELEDEDGMFPYSDFFRDWLASNTKLSELAIKSNNVSDFLIDGKPICDWLNRKPFPITLQSITNYLRRTCLSMEPNDNYLKYAEEDERTIRDSVYLKKGEHKDLVFLELMSFGSKGSNVHFLKFRSKNIAEEAGKF